MYFKHLPDVSRQQRSQQCQRLVIRNIAMKILPPAIEQHALPVLLALRSQQPAFPRYGDDAQPS